MQLKTKVPDNFVKEIELLEKEFEKTIQKISNNRNKIIAHVDIGEVSAYYNMTFSNAEIDRRIEDYEKYSHDTDKNIRKLVIEKYNKLRSSNKNADNERYSPVDFYNDIEIFEKMIGKALDILSRLNLYFYSSSLHA